MMKRSAALRHPTHVRLSLLFASTLALAGCHAHAAPERVVRDFFAVVRSGHAPERAADFLAPAVIAHQVNAEDEAAAVQRSPANYAAHVREMKAAYGEFTIEISELITQGDRVYVRWRQEGTHVGEVDGFAPTHKRIVEVASAVYRVRAGMIVEYWIQIDRAGLRAQLERNQVR
jgi:predicted ester cyclase